MKELLEKGGNFWCNFLFYILPLTEKVADNESTKAADVNIMIVHGCAGGMHYQAADVDAFIVLK